MADRPSLETYNAWTRASLVFVGVLIAMILVKGISETTWRFWPLILLVPLPFVFLFNLWLAFKRAHGSLVQMYDTPPLASQHMMESLFGLTITAACGLVIAVVVGFVIGKSIAH